MSPYVDKIPVQLKLIPDNIQIYLSEINFYLIKCADHSQFLVKHTERNERSFLHL